MTSFGQGNNQTKSAAQKANNPFASSLLENEQKNQGSSDKVAENIINNPFANALRNSTDNNSFDTQKSTLQKQEELLLARRKEALRKQLHDKINPVDTHELFSAKEEKSKEELNQVRKELELLIADIKGLNQDIEVVVAQDVVVPGLDGGTYYHNFFYQLRQFIMLLRQKVSSARSWAQQMQSKSKKRYGLNYKKTKDVQASMNNERNAGANAVG